jgi:predicted PurR-regulated permease PerM
LWYDHPSITHQFSKYRNINSIFKIFILLLIVVLVFVVVVVVVEAKTLPRELSQQLLTEILNTLLENKADFTLRLSYYSLAANIAVTDGTKKKETETLEFCNIFCEL